MNRLREVVLASASASVMIFFMRASGAKGFPLMMPIAATGPISSGSSEMDWLLLHHLVEHFEVSPVVGRNGRV